MKTTAENVKKRRYETSLTKKVLAVALVIACISFVTYTRSVVGAIITTPALAMLMISVFNDRIHATKRTNAIIAILFLTGLLVAALPLISFGEEPKLPEAVADAKPVVTTVVAAETTPVVEETVYTTSEDEDSSYEEEYEEASAIGGGVAPSAPAPAPAVPEVFTPSEPIPLEPDPVNPVEPVKPLPENNKPVVKLIFDGTPIIYVGEVFEIFAKIFDADENDTTKFVGGDVVTSDSNVATGVASQKDAETISIMVTGNSAGYADISLPEGFIIDSQDGSSDASNSLHVKVMEEVVIDNPEIPLEPTEPESPVVEPTEPESPVVEPTEPTTPTVPDVQEPEVPSDQQSDDDVVFESLSVSAQDTVTSVEVQTVDNSNTSVSTQDTVTSVDDSQNTLVSADTVVF